MCWGHLQLNSEPDTMTSTARILHCSEAITTNDTCTDWTITDYPRDLVDMYTAENDSTPVISPWYNGVMIASYSVISPGPTVSVGGPEINEISLST